MANKPYAIGLDIGTASTGYAMTDTNGHLLKYHKRSIFGAVMYEEADTAAKRRVYRSARRRLDRREQRIDLLQMLLQQDICNLDAVFFHRLNESFLQDDERRYPLLYGTLPVSIWTDGSAFMMPDGTPLVEANGKLRTYPTIYHLRNALIHSDKQADIRYVYLALHHIIKYRGHFLLEGQTLSSEQQDIQVELQETLALLADEPLYYDLRANKTAVESIYAALQDHAISRSARADLIVKALAPAKAAKAAAKAFASLIVGNEGSLKALCGYDKGDPAEKLKLSQEDIDTDAYLDALDIHADLFEHILHIYQWQLFSGLREPGETISQTMIRRYEKHQHDLRQLKAWVKAYAPEQYNAMFRDVDEKLKNYCTYSGHYKQRKLGALRVDPCSQEDFYKAVKKLLNSVNTPDATAVAQPMLKAMETENGFMPLLRISFNGAIPNQLHAEELSLILEKQGKYYPSLLENKEKIMSLCTFRLPYYVGPLNPASPFAKWIKRKPNEHAYPWNFETVVDKMATAEGFIQQLTNQCTYLPGENVLPLHSLIYEEYLLLDELNRVTINGKLISQDLKQRLIIELFMRRKRVTEMSFKKWLVENSCYGHADSISIDHLHGDGAFAASLRTFHDFVSHGFIVNDETYPMIERLIRWSTIFENRSILREKIQAAYPELTEQQINYVCKRRYTGWGRLSGKLLDGIQGELDHQPATIIEVLRATNQNFMQIINDTRYGFSSIIEAMQAGQADGPITLEEIRSLPGSPALKRGIWQAARIVEELVAHQGYAPTAIYIENTREDNAERKGKRTVDRISQIEALYREIPEGDVPIECREALNACKRSGYRLNDREFLYFLQLGQCLYSGRPLTFNQLELYQVDHILPQSYIKDDSIDNRALVFSEENQRKSNDLLLSSDIQNRMVSYWRHLKDVRINGISLMSDKKFRNLTRTHVSDREQLGFINRQLIETSQIIKHVTRLFKAHYPETNVVGINARLSSTLRDVYGLFKLRELNDTHHAYDAFLACTLGTFMDHYLSWISDESVAASMARECWKKLTKRDTSGIVLGYFNHDQIDRDTGEILRNANQHIAYLKAVWNYKDHFVVARKYSQSGNFFNETRYPAGSTDAKVPLRKNLPVERYGGFNSVNPAYIAAVTFKKGKKYSGKLVNVPIMLVKEYERDPQVLIDYLVKTDTSFNKCSDIQICQKKILLNQKIQYEGSELLLRSCNEAWNGKQLYLDPEKMCLLNQLLHQPISSWTCTEADLDRLFDALMGKLDKQYPAYAKTVGARLQTATATTRLSREEKGILILETLKIMQVSGNFAMYKAKLPQLGLSDNQGRITNKSFDLSKLVLVHQSITGLYERRTPLWDSAQL